MKDRKEVKGFRYQLKPKFPQGKQTFRKNKGGVQAQKMLEWLWFICAGMRLSQEGFRMTLFSIAWA